MLSVEIILYSNARFSMPVLHLCDTNMHGIFETHLQACMHMFHFDFEKLSISQVEFYFGFAIFLFLLAWLIVINVWRMEEFGDMELVGKLLSLDESMEALFV